MTTYRIVSAGASRSFPEPHAFVDAAAPDGASVVYLGDGAGTAYTSRAAVHDQAAFVAIELGAECLGVYTGDDDAPANVLGFARFRLGDAPPTTLVELVRKPSTSDEALAAARAAFEAAGLVVAVCQDVPGRIVDRLVRPYYNAALRRLDDGLASAADMDITLRLGLGYPEGPIALLNRTGLHHHYEVTQALYEQLGQEAYAPARRARVAWMRRQSGEGSE
jgi:3-hydroxybutyryl-CoA dehydrogenase